MEEINYDAYYAGLEVLSYKKIIEILENQDERHLITFDDFTDFFGTKKKYYSVKVRNLDEDKTTIYSSPDQDDRMIEKNLYEALSDSNMKTNYSIYTNDYVCMFMCTIGNNNLVFPREAAKRIMEEFNTPMPKQKTKKKELNLFDGELPFEI